MKVFVVEISDAEASHVISIHETYEGALKSWNKEREELIKQAKRLKFWEVSRGWYHDYDSWYNKTIKNLSCEDPSIIDNYPHETPRIVEYVLMP